MVCAGFGVVNKVFDHMALTSFMLTIIRLTAIQKD